MYKSGDAYTCQFTTQRFDTGAAADADSLPVATATRNGADDAAFVLTVAKLDTGRYKVTGTIPGTYAVGDRVGVSVAATVAGIAAKAVIDSLVLSDALATQATAQAAATAAQAVNSRLPETPVDVSNLDPEIVLSANVDSTGASPLTLKKAIEAMLAVLAGTATYDQTLGIEQFKGRDGLTTIVSNTVTGLGVRSASTIS